MGQCWKVLKITCSCSWIVLFEFYIILLTCIENYIVELEIFTYCRRKMIIQSIMANTEYLKSKVVKLFLFFVMCIKFKGIILPWLIKVKSFFIGWKAYVTLKGKVKWLRWSLAVNLNHIGPRVSKIILYKQTDSQTLFYLHTSI